MEAHQIEAMVVEGTKKGLAEFLKGVVNKVNIFTALQIFWLVEVYYLMCNSVLSILDNLEITNGNSSISALFPTKVKLINEVVLQYFNEWSNFVLCLSVILFISGSIISITKSIPKISDYNLIYRYCGYGVYASLWLLLIYGTYELFSISVLLFCIMIPIVAVFCEITKSLKKRYIDRLY